MPGAKDLPFGTAEVNRYTGRIVNSPPLFIVLPGGAYESHADTEAEPVADWLRSLGLEALVFRYPVRSSAGTARDAVHDLVSRARSGGMDGLVYDATRVGVIGFSAGGHLAGHAALTGIAGDSRPDLAVLSYPVVSMRRDPHVQSRDHLLGSPATLVAQHAASLENLVTVDAPPMFLWHTAADTDVPASHTYGLAGALAASGVYHSCHVFPRGAHGLDLAKGAGTTTEAWTPLLEAFLNELGWLATAT